MPHFQNIPLACVAWLVLPFLGLAPASAQTVESSPQTKSYEIPPSPKRSD